MFNRPYTPHFLDWIVRIGYLFKLLYLAQFFTTLTLPGNSFPCHKWDKRSASSLATFTISALHLLGISLLRLELQLFWPLLCIRVVVCPDCPLPFTALTVALSSSPSFRSCFLVASLILGDSMAFFRSHSFCLKSFALATLSLYPSINLAVYWICKLLPSVTA